MGFNLTADESFQMGMNSRERKLDEIERRLAVVEKKLESDVRENVRGEWIEWKKCTPFYIQDLYKCSKCNESYLKELVYFLDNLQYRFCPNCGADMRGRSEDGRTNDIS